MESPFCIEIEPESTPSNLSMILKTVVFPTPFEPIRPTRSLGRITRSLFSKMICPPNCLFTFSNRIIKIQKIKFTKLLEQHLTHSNFTFHQIAV